jgi:hypothetical protein
LYIEEIHRPEVYYWENPTDETKCIKKTYDFKNPYPFLVIFSLKMGKISK